MAEKVKTVGGVSATKPLSDFALVNVGLGKTFYVDSVTGDNGRNGRSAKTAVATIDYAIGLCTANKGDVIYVLPGHTESITTAGAIALDVAGVSIVGLGRGSIRPTISFWAAAATIAISAANCSIENMIFNANFADVVVGVKVTAANAQVKNCLFKEAGADLNWLSCIATGTVDNAADGLEIVGNERISIDAAALAFVSILANTDRLKIMYNFDNQASAADVGHFLIMAAKVCLGAQIIGNVLNLTGDNNAQTVGVFATGSSTTSTGVMAYNLVGSLDTTTELIVTAALDFQQFENYYTGTIAASGKLWPAVDGA